MCLHNIIQEFRNFLQENQEHLVLFVSPKIRRSLSSTNIRRKENIPLIHHNKNSADVSLSSQKPEHH